MGRLPYTREKLELIVLTQLDRIESLSELIIETKNQTDLVVEVNKRLREELASTKASVRYASRKKS